MEITEQDLLSLGFVDKSWCEEYESFTEHELKGEWTGVLVSGLSLFEFYIEQEYVKMDIQSLSELDTVIKAFGLNKK